MAGVAGSTSTNGSPGVSGKDASSTGGFGVSGTSTAGVGVLASSTSGTALQVEGTSTFSGAMATASIAATGAVSGSTLAARTSISAPSVTASTTGSGTALTGTSSRGVGVLAESSSGTALKVAGKLELSRSGLATVTKGGKSVKVTLAGVTSSSMVLATIQGNAGAIAVANAIPGVGSFTINLTGAAPAAVKIAWFVIN